MRELCRNGIVLIYEIFSVICIPGNIIDHTECAHQKESEKILGLIEYTGWSVVGERVEWA